ncbi:MAG: hypothetical protein ACRC33_09735, partial [Gemmataceae bacterium]
MSAFTCPFCNSRVTAPAAGPQPCPRCGETISPPADAVTAPPAGPAPAPAGKPVRANRLVGAIVLAVMATMATVGLTFAL